MPRETSFPIEVQVAFFVFNLLSDRWEGMSGMYLGKEWTNCEYLFELHEIKDTKITYFFMKMIETLTIEHHAKKQEQQRKKEERQRSNSGGGKTYTHNVRG